MAERISDRETGSHNAPGFVGMNQMDVRSTRFGVGILPIRHHTVFQDSHKGEVSVLSASIPMAQATVNRMWVWCPEDGLLVIRDTWTRTGKEEPELWFHGGDRLRFTQGPHDTVGLESSEPQKNETLLTLNTWNPVEGRMLLPPETVQEPLISPIPSTVSPRYGCKRSSESVRLTVQAHGKTTCLLTLISLSDQDLSPTWTPSALSWTPGTSNTPVWAYTAQGDFTRGGVLILTSGKSGS